MKRLIVYLALKIGILKLIIFSLSVLINVIVNFITCVLRKRMKTSDNLCRTKFPNSIRLDGGSDWVVISRDFAEYALSDEELPLNFRKFFANVLLPVETFFHTVGEY